ncbi:phosphoribosylaminoimidazolesuccinocarboxamide synthase [Nocardiopsis sp. CNT312]|uniref:phosphoribosylaminoimidazolesuccinocarboxamide synthase n=1 Tax=Nocardiopsis sp. CNT312 TaxID=1137268 RepID=UPI00048BEF18|nr:phosphoribosylaminoimidazolesuccinocarboxamide synthase [Nocardiopsis sp. CNT312]
MPVLHSTKNLHVVEPPTPNRTGIGVFTYTDHYTVFHYGRMPDAIPGKGEATCRMAAFNFALLEEAGISTHFRRFIPPNRIEFDLGRLPAPGTSPPPTDEANRLIPVQVLFRNELPQGSSVHRRLSSGALTLADLSLDTAPAVGEKLPRPIIEYATMLDDTNRFVTASQAQRLAALDDDQFQTMCARAVAVNEALSAHARKRGLDHCDGKVEFLLSDQRRLVVADSPGTPDESRLLYQGVHCGKQVLRNWYVDSGLEVPTSRLIAQGVPRSQWPTPAPLPSEFVPVMSDLYRSLSQTWTGQALWDVPDLACATRAVTHLIGR